MALVPGLQRSLEVEIATHSSILAGEISQTEKLGTVHGVAKSLCLKGFLSSCIFILLSIFFFKKKKLLFLAVLSLCCTWVFFSCGEQGLLFILVCGLLIEMTSHVQHMGFSSWGTQALELELSSCGAQA